MKVAIEKKFKNLFPVLSKDIYQLHACHSITEFNFLKSLFYTKYENKGDEFREFLVYFKSQWDSSRFKWFEGWLKDQPSTNNGLEATNRWIKNNYTNRTRKQLHEFIPICMNM